MIMAAFWVTEALPLAITSLLPVALLPLLGNNATVIFSSTAAVCSMKGKSASMPFSTKPHVSMLSFEKNESFFVPHSLARTKRNKS